MKPCAVCKQFYSSLDHDTCPRCLLLASQSLVTACDIWYCEQVKTLRIQNKIRAYLDANSYLGETINWQGQYHTSFIAYTASLTARQQYREAFRATRLFSDPDVMQKYLGNNHYLSAALQSADMRNKA